MLKVGRLFCRVELNYFFSTYGWSILVRNISFHGHTHSLLRNNIETLESNRENYY